MARERICGIYKIKNLINGKVYIGQSVDIYKRWGDHKSMAIAEKYKIGYDYPLYRAFRKYGLENFSFEVIEECDREELNEREMYYIESYRSYIKYEDSNGYNQTLGGDGALGKEFSEETKIKISKANKGKLVGGKNPSSKKVVCENIEFNCAKDCAKYYKLKDTTLRSWLNGSHKMPQEWIDKGLRYFDKPIEGYKVQKGFSGENHTKSIPIYCDGIKFANARECAEYYDVNVNTVKNWINGENDMPKEWYDKGLHKEGKTMEDYKVQENKVIICEENSFNTIKSCAKYYGIKPVTMQGWLSGRNKMPQEFKDKGLRYYNN